MLENKDKRVLFNKLAHSDVFLNEAEHVYIHKKTGEIFPSVTTMLNLVKAPFDKDFIIPLMQKKNKTFVNWYKKRGSDLALMPELLSLYCNYEKLREPVAITEWQGKETKRFKAITHYETTQELYNELIQIKQSNPSSEIKATYLNDKYEVMSFDEIVDLWTNANELSRHYGHLIHECLEDHVLNVQHTHTTKTKKEKEKNILAKYIELQDAFSRMDFGFNSDYFSPYIVNLPVLEFKDYIIECYKKSVSTEQLGQICIPEKIIHSKKHSLCGMCDQLVVTDWPSIQIPDHKTNKKFTTSSDYGKYLLYPLNDLEDCSASTYMLQTNTYGYILENEYDMKFEGGWISYFDRNKHKFDIYEMPVETKYTQILLEHYELNIKLELEEFNSSGWLDGIPAIYKNYTLNKISDDLNNRLKLGTIDVYDRLGNKKYYKEFTTKIVNKLQKLK